MFHLNALGEKLVNAKQNLLFVVGGQLLCMSPADNEADSDRCYPPYRDARLLTASLEVLDRAPLRDQAVLVVEHHRSQPLPPLQRLTQVRDRDYGSTRLTFFRYL